MSLQLPDSAIPGTARWLADGVLFCLPPATHDAAAVNAYYDAIRDHLDASVGRYVIVSDTRHVTSLPDARTRRVHGERSAELTARFPNRCIHSATVVDNAPMRAVLTAINWFMGDSKSPHTIVATPEEALRVAERALAEHRGHAKT